MPRQALGWVERQRVVQVAQRTSGVAGAPAGAAQVGMIARAPRRQRNRPLAVGYRARTIAEPQPANTTAIIGRRQLVGREHRATVDRPAVVACCAGNVAQPLERAGTLGEGLRVGYARGDRAGRLAQQLFAVRVATLVILIDG